MTFWWINLIGSTIGFTLGSALLKLFADTRSLSLLLVSFTVLAVSNVLFVQVIRSGLGQGIIVSSMAQVILIAALGMLVFGERLSVSQALGVACAVASIFFMTRSGIGVVEG